MGKAKDLIWQRMNESKWELMKRKKRKTVQKPLDPNLEPTLYYLKCHHAGPVSGIFFFWTISRTCLKRFPWALILLYPTFFSIKYIWNCIEYGIYMYMHTDIFDLHRYTCAMGVLVQIFYSPLLWPLVFRGQAKEASWKDKKKWYLMGENSAAAERDAQGNWNPWWWVLWSWAGKTLSSLRLTI